MYAIVPESDATLVAALGRKRTSAVCCPQRDHRWGPEKAWFSVKLSLLGPFALVMPEQIRYSDPLGGDHSGASISCASERAAG